MKKEKAIKILQFNVELADPELREALEMAISALEKQEKALEQEFNEWCPDCAEYDKEKHCCHRFTKVIRQTVKECKREWANEGWIPVTERLPETTDEVLTTYINNGNRKKRYVETATYYPDDGEGTWSSPWDEYRVVGTAVEVLAWRPLPEAYTEEES